MDYLKNKLGPSQGALKGILRGIIIGMLCSSIFTYIGVLRLDGNARSELMLRSVKSQLQQHVSVKENAADYLYDKIRVLCFMLPISKQKLNSTGNIFVNIWPKRCHKFIFFADEAGN
jgi:hypothetical protein